MVLADPAGGVLPVRGRYLGLPLAYVFRRQDVTMFGVRPLGAWAVEEQRPLIVPLHAAEDHFLSLPRGLQYSS